MAGTNELAAAAPAMSDASRPSRAASSPSIRRPSAVTADTDTHDIPAPPRQTPADGPPADPPTIRRPRGTDRRGGRPTGKYSGRVPVLGLAGLAFAAAELMGGNGFIAAFVAGLTLGNTQRTVCTRVYEFGPSVDTQIRPLMDT